MPLEVECLVADEERSLPVAIALPLPRYSLPQRLRSGYHALWYRLGERLSWSRGVYCERPVRRLNHLNGIQQARIAALQRRFAVQFEQNTEHLTALKSYDYLDILGQAWSMWGALVRSVVSCRMSGPATSGTPECCMPFFIRPN